MPLSLDQTSILTSDCSSGSERKKDSGTKTMDHKVMRKLECKERQKEAEKDGTISVEGNHHHIRVFHEKATSGA